MSADVSDILTDSPKDISDAGSCNAESHSRFLIPPPTTVAETGLTLAFLTDFILKHLYQAGVVDFPALAARTALMRVVLDEIMVFLKEEALIQVLAQRGESAGLRYDLTDRGRSSAMRALEKSGYVGPAPIPLASYKRLVEAQSVHQVTIQRDQMLAAFEDVVIDPALLNQLGPALHSGRAIFLYGHAGTGKSFISRRLTSLLGGDVFVPYAIAVGETVIELFDPVVHQRVGPVDQPPSLLLDESDDPRYVLCQRPIVITGGELTLAHLEMRFDSARQQYSSPLQMKANNGVMILDDLGRQRAPSKDLRNRWIVPMEEQVDYHNLGSGKYFQVPFDLVMMFSTNMNPHELADEAFLRRIGHKVGFHPISSDQYRSIWQQVCEQLKITCQPEVCEYVINELHEGESVPLLPCHPRDLLTMAADQARYLDGEPTVERSDIEWAWKNYFVSF